MATLVEQKFKGTAQYFTEDLNGVALEMVLIPSGSFNMGAPKGELESIDDERPQHTVVMAQFCMGKYPVTQAQWRAVTAMPQVDRKLEPDLYQFKEDNRPVEQVTWHDAVEFCDRLSALTKRSYRLPSEAEWEYACRAGTTTPFHFGETISSDYANYDVGRAYGSGSEGKDRKETTPVGSFNVANRFGLYDMHGNVWEWCADHWHDNYEGAPIDGSAWVTGGNSDRRVLRGGSWNTYPARCRSAFRNRGNPVLADYPFGFRVVSSASRT